MKLLICALLVSCSSAFTPSDNSVRSLSALSESSADLEVLAKELNPVLRFFDPIGLSKRKLWGTTEEESIGFLREAEVKHGRIAMFAFVGYVVHANGITWPWPMTLEGDPFPEVSSAPEAWDAIPEAAKLQIILFVGFLEYWNEVANKHYMKGGRIGDFPDFDTKVIPGGALNLFDPFGWNKSRSEEAKAKGLVKEINNGRLAMLGIFAFLCESKIPGSVPALTGVIPPYDGDFMAPFATSLFPTLSL